MKNIRFLFRPRLHPSHILYLVLALLLSGCLPHGCQRDGYTELMPADSLSRQIAAETPADTLEHVWSTTGDASAQLAFPRTVRFSEASGRLFVSDVERNSVFVFTPKGEFAREVTNDAFDVPYLAGLHADTLVVLNAGSDRLAFVHEDQLVHSFPLGVERGPLLYAAATDTAVYAKVVGEEASHFVARLDRRGNVVSRAPLPGPDWRHAGMLRAWGDSLLSLSGFRPVVDVVPLPLRDGAAVDTLALRGFDSPMLERSRAFLTGEVSTAPLLTPSAAPAGDYLFVINVRPGWLQVDVYDQAGHLQRRLTQANPEYEENFYPRDIAVRARDGGYDIAVVLTDPEPRLDLYRWVPGS